ncbi:MAG: phosphoribosylglycinamide formyltransferase [Candidatus Krumholzibacteria bacterium]|jgi:phosphoribosylglycinamide formyltransferase-1|nr:phosphoribosylglycinamide formyltransferase [Candidatus Krumholzibacteria bacterium]
MTGMPAAPARLAVLLSGSGRTLANLLAWQQRGDLPADLVGVVSSRGDVQGVIIARQAGLPVVVLRRRDFPDATAHNAAIAAWLEPRRPQIVALAGYLCHFARPAWFTGPVVNIHPALLPKYGGQGMYGDRVHAAVLAAGEHESGCTVHHVEAEYDRGRIIAQRRVPVLPGDDAHSLAARVFAAECELYPRVLADLARQATRP